MERRAVLIGGLSIKGRKALLDIAVKNLAECSEEVRILVIVDNFDDLKFDSYALPACNVELLTGGCFCCTLREDLKRLIEDQMKALDPNVMLIEMPITADSRSMRSLVNESLGCEVEPTIVFTVDLESWEKVFQAFTKPMISNLQSADVIALISKEKSDGIPNSIQDQIASWPSKSICRFTPTEDIHITLIARKKEDCWPLE